MYPESMKERGKAVETYGTNFNYSVSDMPCFKHPNSSSSVGICAHCLKDRLVKLVCSECGEQRLSSCSCSDASSSSYRNSCSSTMDVGSVGRISFLLENEKTEQQSQLINNNTHQKPKTKDGKTEQVIFLRRSSSSCVEVKKSNNGFWKIKRLFRKKRRSKMNDDDDEEGKSEIWVPDVNGMSRSKSLCSFRGGGGGGGDEGGGDYYAFSSAKLSDVTSCERQSSSSWYCGENNRKSGFGGMFDAAGVDFRRSASGKNSIENRSIFPVKESDFSAMDESAFIDFKLDSLSLLESSAARISGASSDHGLKIGCETQNHENGVKNLGGLKREGINGGGGSCKIGVNERRGLKSNKVWKWIFKYNNHPARNSFKL